jgi:hypothetical protein
MKRDEDQWFVLGFTAEDVTTAQQDSRLAQACVGAWRAAGEPPEFTILEAPGDGDHLLLWFVSGASAPILDEHEPGWRRFVIGTLGAPPPGARPFFFSEGTRRP